MTNEEKYTALLMELAQLITDKNDRIMVLEWQLKGAQREIEEAEKTIEELKGAGGYVPN